MTICIATNVFYPDPGGIPGYYKNLADILMANGHHVMILTIDPAADPTAQDEVINDILFTKVILRATYKKHKVHYKKYFRPGGFTAYNWIAMGKAMHEWLLQNHSAYKIDIIETTDYGGAGIFLTDDRLPPVVVIGHSSLTQVSKYQFVKDDDHAKVIRELEILSFRYCNAIVAHSPMNQEDLAELTSKKVEFARAPWLPPAMIPQSSGKISGNNLVVNSLQAIKGAIVMAEAVSRIKVKRPNWSADWVGGDSFTAPEGQRMSGYLKQNFRDTWNSNFRWQNQKTHIETLTAIINAGLVIIPSVWDTFNYVSLEAGFFQRRLIMTETTGSSYLFKDDENVTIIKANDPGKMANELIKLEGMKLDTIVTDQTRNNIIAYFNASKILEEHMAVYTAAISNRVPTNNAPAESLEFLDKYTTFQRKLYYRFRATVKKLVKPKND